MVFARYNIYAKNKKCVLKLLIESGLITHQIQSTDCGVLLFQVLNVEHTHGFATVGNENSVHAGFFEQSRCGI